MKINTTDFYKELESITKDIVDGVENKFAVLTREELLKKTSPEKWSVGECLEHLNCYGNFYLKAMRESLEKAKESNPNAIFKTGFFGNKFAEMLRYKKVGMKTMKSPKIKSLTFNEVSESVIETFLKQQKEYLAILEETKSLNLEKVKVPVAISKLIKTKIGDTLRFTIYHNQRHFIQAKKQLQ